jgi:dual oxidase
MSDGWQDSMANSTMEQLMRGLASQIAEREDHVLCSDVRNKLFGPLEFSRRDLGELKLILSQ